MSKEGRLARGKENFEHNRNLNNPETLEYMETIKPKEKKKNARKSR